MGAEAMVGMGLWQSKAGTLAVEVPIGLIDFLALIHAGNLFGEPPPSLTASAWAGQAQWLLVAWAYGVDAHRRGRPAP